jgi:hypothetical protein
MKAEINNQSKVKFFALYWGQLVMQGSWRNALEALYPITFDSIGKCHNYHLRLKPLSAISDEDAIEVAKIALGFSKITKNIEITTTTDRRFGFSFWLNNEVEYMIDFNNLYNPTLIALTRKTADNEYLHNACNISDYLRSKGYALPWMGLSVEEMVEAGWIKLIEA